MKIITGKGFCNGFFVIANYDFTLLTTREKQILF